MVDCEAMATAKKSPGFSDRRIEDYGFIGNLNSAALVGGDGSIDWFCAPRFDSDACFAALLGTPENGRWLIAPVKTVKAISRQYLPGTAMLETVFQTSAGKVSVTDFMPLTPTESIVELTR